MSHLESIVPPSAPPRFGSPNMRPSSAKPTSASMQGPDRFSQLAPVQQHQQLQQQPKQITPSSNQFASAIRAQEISQFPSSSPHMNGFNPLVSPKAGNHRLYQSPSNQRVNTQTQQPVSIQNQQSLVSPSLQYRQNQAQQTFPSQITSQIQQQAQYHQQSMRKGGSPLPQAQQASFYKTPAQFQQGIQPQLELRQAQQFTTDSIDSGSQRTIRSGGFNGIIGPYGFPSKNAPVSPIVQAISAQFQIKGSNGNLNQRPYSPTGRSVNGSEQAISSIESVGEQSEVQSMKQTLLHSKISSLISEVNSMQILVVKKNKEAQLWKQKYEELESGIYSLQDEGRYPSLASSTVAVRSQSLKQLSMHENESSQVAELVAKIKDLENKLLGKNTLSDAQLDSFNSIVNSKDSLISQLYKVNKELTDKMKGFEKKADDSTSVREDNAKKADQLRELNEKEDRLNEREDELDLKEAELRVKIQRLNESLASLQVRESNLKSEEEAIRRGVEKLRARSQQMRNRDSHKEDLSENYSSTSYEQSMQLNQTSEVLRSDLAISESQKKSLQIENQHLLSRIASLEMAFQKGASPTLKSPLPQSNSQDKGDLKKETRLAGIDEQSESMEDRLNDFGSFLSSLTQQHNQKSSFSKNI